MKFNINKMTLLKLSYFTLLMVLPLLQSCKNEDVAIEWVDLRYKVEDSYLIEAKDIEKISFQVKSTDSWEVFGKYDWHTISPDKGEAGETATVTIVCKENTSLDDRIDTINIKSNYWTGKKFILKQKGIAFLNVENIDFLLNKNEDQKIFNVLSNQKWTAKVTEGDNWLSLVSGDSGEMNGEVKVKSQINTGEKRTAKVTIFDRHGAARQIVDCVQDGVMLLPTIPENGKWFVTYEQAQTLEVAVEANAEWIASKDNEDDDWYTITKESFSGSDKLIIQLSEHKGTNVRTGIINLASKVEEGATPVVKQVKFKQANPQITEVKELNQTINGSYYGPGGLAAGIYHFHVSAMSSTQFNLFFAWGEVELRYWIQDAKTILSTRPWCADVFAEHGSCIKPVDVSKPNIFSINIVESIDSKGQSWIYSEWMLNGTKIVSAISDGITGAGYDDTWKVPWSATTSGASLSITTVGGSALFEKYEYIAPLVWGE